MLDHIVCGVSVSVYIDIIKTCFDYLDCVEFSNNFVEIQYNKKKSEKLADCGIRRIVIWSDDWVTNKTRIQNFIKNIVVKQNVRIGARKTTIRNITTKEYSEFLDKHHMQGARVDAIMLGCIYDDQICAVMGFSKTNSNTKHCGYYLTRFANTNVTGAFSKLVSHFRKEHNVDVYSFADLQIVDRYNNVYINNGFDPILVLDADYKYFNEEKTKVRKHKFGFRKSNFKALGLDIEGKTEKQLSIEYGLVRCYDSGKILYKLEKCDTIHT
jgi:hypothetical protein